MHFGFAHTLVIAAVISTLWVVVRGGDRLFPLIAVAAAGLEALLTFNVITLSVVHFRIDVILPALLLVAAAVSWMKTSTKAEITAATVATMIGAIQLLLALHVLD